MASKHQEPLAVQILRQGDHHPVVMSFKAKMKNFLLFVLILCSAVAWAYFAVPGR